MKKTTRDSRASTGRGLRIVAAGLALYGGRRLWQRWKEVDLEGRVVLVTGGSRGFGFALAREFAREGAILVICARDPAELQNAVRELDALGANGIAVECDVSNPRSVAAMMRAVREEVGGIDVLVNNATVIQVGPVGSMTLDDFRDAMGVNFWGTVHTTLEVLPEMKRRGEGRIVNITSIGGKLSPPHLLPYNCAKFAAVGFSEGLRAELSRHGVRVTTVVPGLMRTGGPANAWFKGDPAKEFAWFSVGDATSLTSISATRAARKVVRAVKRGEAEVTLSWQAKLARVTQGLLPGITADLLGAVDRLLPKEETVREGVRGMDLETRISPSWVTTQMNRAARDLHQYSGSRKPSHAHAVKIGLDGDRHRSE